VVCTHTREMEEITPGDIVLDGDPAPPARDTAAPLFSPQVCCGQTTLWIKMRLGMEVGLGPGHIVWGPVPPQRSTVPQFSARVKRLDGSRCHLLGM